MIKWIVLAVLFVGGAVGFFLLQDRQYEIRLTEAQLLEQIDRKLPFTKSYLAVFDISLENPRITMPEDGKRVLAGLDIIADVRIGAGKQIKGSADVSAGIRYAAEAGEFYLVDPNIEHLETQDIPLLYSTKADDAIRKTLAAFFRSQPVYTLKDSDAKQKSAKMVLQDVMVEEGVLVLTLGF